MEPRLKVLEHSRDCVVCGVVLPAGAWVWGGGWAKAATCASCYDERADRASPAGRRGVDRGRAAASVGREAQRRKERREAEAREAHPLTGALRAKLGRESQREAAFRSGALGEQAVEKILEERHAQGSLIALHDRRIPRRGGNIDHIAVAPTGVYVIDAKRYKGKIRREGEGFSAPRLTIRGRNRPKLLKGLGHQVAVVRDVLGAGGYGDVVVQGVLCFTTGDLPRFKTLEIGEYLVLGLRRLGKQLDVDGPLPVEAIEEIAHLLADALPPKVTASES
jgi:hypothetical protein